MRPHDGFEEFEIDLAPIWPAEDARLEPIFLDAPLWFEFEQVEQVEQPEPELDEATAQQAPVEFAEFEQLEPGRMPLEEDEPRHVQLASRQPASPGGFLGSLGVHVLPLVFLIGWSNSPSQIGGAIPVQLVIEESRPPQDEPLPTQLAAETTSEKAADVDTGGPTAATPPPKPPPKKRLAATAPRPAKPKPPPQPVAEPRPRQPAAPTQPAVATPSPPVASRTDATQHQAPREARAGPGLDRSNYFSHLVVLTRPHFHMLPASFLAGRRGRTILTLVVREDGEVERIILKRGSGYPDIDARVQQMVAAVGRFPPLPQSFRAPTVELDFDLLFPDGLQ